MKLEDRSAVTVKEIKKCRKLIAIKTIINKYTYNINNKSFVHEMRECKLMNLWHTFLFLVNLKTLVFFKVPLTLFIHDADGEYYY